MSRLRHPLVVTGIAVLLTIPWVFVFLTPLTIPLLGVTVPTITLGDYGTVLVAGLAVVGASFLLAWGAETAEKDVPRAFAIAVLAVLAVAPEYAVDAYYAWTAGSGGATAQACADLSQSFVDRVTQLPASEIDTPREELAMACENGNLAVANMTGANRILIGLGWSGIALYTVWRVAKTNDSAVIERDGRLRDAVQLDHDISLEIAFLLMATAWAFFVPLGGGIDMLDTVLLVGLYVAYIVVVIRGDVDPVEEHVGVPAYFQGWRRAARVPAVLLFFAYSGALILTAVEPFALSLEHIGIENGIPRFFMIQWIAPLASESPELIVVAVLVNKARATAGFNALISSKLNQWTLLIGTIAVVYSLGLGSVGTLPFDPKQSAEIWITAAQSFFAIALLINFEISAREAVALFVLFISQVVIEFAMIQNYVDLPIDATGLLLIYTAIYLSAGIALFVRRRKPFRALVREATDGVRTALGRSRKHSEGEGS